MELSQLVRACEETAGGEEEVAALESYCESRLGSPVSQEMVRALANTARTEAGRQRIRESSLVQSIGQADWDCGDHNTAIEVRSHRKRFKVRPSNTIGTSHLERTIFVEIRKRSLETRGGEGC